MMGQFTAIETLGTFHVPAFDILLDTGTKLDRLKWDVIDVSYTDDIDALDSFDITLADWDPLTLEPVYSCPYDSDGNRKSYAGGQSGRQMVPLLVPGTGLRLSMGYQDGPGQMAEMMRGKVASMTSSFPASGVPTAKVRVVSHLGDYVKTPLSGKVKGGVLDVLAAVAQQLDLKIDLTSVPAELRAAHEKQSEPVTILTEFKTVMDVRRLARSIGLSVRLEPGPDKQVLKVAAQDDVAYSMGWGKSLLSFTPTISTKKVVKAVTVRVQDPLGKSADKQKYEGKATWSDMKLTQSKAVGAVMLGDVIDALGETAEVIVLPSRLQMRDPFETAKARLRQAASELIRGAGQTVGLPLLRAGARVEITGVGSSYNGIYEVTKTTHSLGSAGYSTSFEGRKEIFA